MARRSKASDNASVLVGCLAIAGIGLLLIAKALLAIWPYLLVIGIIFLCGRWVNQKLKYRQGDWREFYLLDLKPVLKILTIVLPILAVVVGWFIYENRKLEKKKYFEREAARIEQSRQDSLSNEERLFKMDQASSLYSQASLALDKKNPAEAILLLDSSLIILPDNDEALLQKAKILTRQNKCSDAISSLNKVRYLTDQRDSLMFVLGSCIAKKDKKEAARIYLKMSESGDQKALKMYNKLNPIIKKYSHSMTRCCDGATSSSSGRGTCSHHGGVCGKKAFYNETRKYPDIN